MGQLTENQRKIVEGHLAAVGDEFYYVVVDALISFLDEPGVKDIFPWADPEISSEQHRQLPGFKRHVESVARHFQDCLGHLDTIDTKKEKLKNLGTRHEKRSVKLDLYQKLGGCVVKSVQSRVGDTWNQECRDAWVAAYEVLVIYMTTK